MTAEQLWAAYVAKNPSFDVEGGTVTMTTAGLKKFFEQTFEKGREHEKNLSTIQKEVAEMLRRATGNR